jgi:hypothetical protein
MPFKSNHQHINLNIRKQKDTLTQKLIEEREDKDHEISELKKGMADYERHLASVKDMQDQVNNPINGY